MKSEIKKFLQNDRKRILGVYLWEKYIYLAGLIREDPHWSVLFFSKEPLHIDDETIQVRDVAEQIKMLCLKENFNSDFLAFSVSAAQTFCYQKKFPEMSLSELSESVRWDIDANVPYAENAYWYDFCYQNDAVWLAAIEKNGACDILDAFQKAGLQLTHLTMEALAEGMNCDAEKIEWQQQAFSFSDRIESRILEEGDRQAFIAAASVIAAPEKNINFLPEVYRHSLWNWKKISCSLILIFLCILSSISVVNYWRLYKLNGQLREKTQQLMLLNRDNQKIARLTQMKDERDRTNLILTNLSADRLSWYSILIHLGVLNVEDVWLSDVTIDENHYLQLQGKAKNYQALVDYIHKFETENEIFTERPMLTRSEMMPGDIIVFTMQIK